jgi:hypothetical protein
VGAEGVGSGASASAGGGAGSLEAAGPGSGAASADASSAIGVATSVTLGGMPGGGAALGGDPAQPQLNAEPIRTQATRRRLERDACMMRMLIFPLDVPAQEQAARGRAGPEIPSSSMSRRWTFYLLFPAACHAAPGTRAVDDADPMGATAADAGRPRVQLTWRLFETQRWLEGHDRRESAVIELLVNGGVPSRVELGRRDTAGCAIRHEGGSTADDPVGALTAVDCTSARAQVFRSDSGELRVVAGDRSSANAAGGASWIHERTVTVRVPAGAEVTVDSDLSRIPDEAPSP